MSSRFAAAIAAAAEQAPQAGSVETVPGRLLLADGDGLCYYCAGKDDTAPGQARINLIDKLRSAASASGAERIKVLLTSRASHKGFRFAVARVKPYQGHRDGKQRPRNWEYLRTLLETGDLPQDIEIEFTAIAEADDLFSRYEAAGADCVTYTQDKDMQMVPGLHLDWLSHRLFNVPRGTWAQTVDEKVYGRRWFWMQMLHGDQADNIPGLPFYKDGSITKSGPNKGKVTEIKCGPAAAEHLLRNLSSDHQCALHLPSVYETCYGDRWLVEMLEQGILLWMRTDAASSPLDVVAKGNPLHFLTQHELYPAARAEIMARIAESFVNAETESCGSSDSAEPDAAGPRDEVSTLSTALQPGGCGSGPRSPHGIDPCSDPSVVQCATWKAGERAQAVRDQEPRGVSSWVRFVLPKVR